MPAIKGDIYINTHCNYSQPALIKLDNENIGGHLTPLQTERALYSRFALKNLPKWGFGGILGGGVKIFGGNKLGLQRPPIYVVW